MSKTRSSRETGKDVLRLFADALVPYLRERLSVATEAAGPAFYSQQDSPLGRRRHLELVRRGVLAGRKLGRLVLIRREEVHAFIEQHQASSPPPASEDPLAEWGLVPRTAR